MRAAQGTKDFVLSWIKGNLRKKQYQSYYLIVKDKTSFLIKTGEKGKEVCAIRDHFGHIFIPNTALQGATGWTDNSEAEKNPFFNLMEEEVVFPFTLLNNNLSAPVCKNLSTWVTRDQDPTLSLVNIANENYIVHQNIRNKITVANWLNNNRTSNNPAKTPYQSLVPIGSQNSIHEWKQTVLEDAGDYLEFSFVEEGYMFIATDKTDSKEILGFDFHEVAKTRPSCSAYMIPDKLINRGYTSKRFFPFIAVEEYNRQMMRATSPFLETDIPDLNELNYTDLEFRLGVRGVSVEVRKNIVQFLKDDDAWLKVHGDKIKPVCLGDLIAKQCFYDAIGTALITTEKNSSKLPDVLWFRGLKASSDDKMRDTFYKILPVTESSVERMRTYK